MGAEEEIRFYLENRDVLLQEWYRKQVAYATGIEAEPTGVVGDLWQGFNRWVDAQKPKLRKVVCPKIHEIRAAATSVHAVFIISHAINYEAFIGPVTETACLLFHYGAETLCDTNEPRAL